MKNLIIAVDFDDTICKNAYPEIGEPNFRLISALRKAKEKGAKLILWTCRDKGELKEAISWCAGYNLFFDAINDDLEEIKNSFYNKSHKVFAHIYLDDRNYDIEKFIKTGFKND